MCIRDSFSDVVSISQSRRAAGFVPFAVAVVGAAAVLARVLSWGALPLALGAGIAFQVAYPGDFGYGLDEGGPAVVTWIALAGGAAALAAGVFLPRRFAELDARGPLAAAVALVAVVPVAVHGLATWEQRETRGLQLTPGLVAAIERRVPDGGVVFSDVESSYRIAAVAPVYVANGPPGHVADTRENRPYERRDDERKFFRTGNLRIPRRYGAEWLIVNVARHKLRLELRPVYRDDRFALYDLST